jgi:hypothetical protein
MVKKNINEGKKGAEKNQRKNNRTLQNEHFALLRIAGIPGNAHRVIRWLMKIGSGQCLKIRA